MRDTNIRVPIAAEYLDMACRCCGERKVRLVIDLGDQPEANRLVRPDTPRGSEPSYPLRFGYCENCTMMQIDHTIPRDLMYQGNVYVSGTSKTLPAHFAATTDRLIAEYGIKRSDLVVDIGSNDGTWVKCWDGKADAYGVEPDERIAMMAEDDGVRTFNDYFDLQLARDIAITGKAKCITSNGSFFHMEDLHGACEGVRELLRDDGVFIVQALSGLDMLWDTAFDQILHEHLLYYTVNSFRDLMYRHGMDVFDVRHLSIQGGSIEYHVRKIGHRQGTSSELNYGAVGFDDCREFSERVLRLRDELLSTLTAYRKAGKSVWAYGAPGKATTLFNSFGIGPDLVQCAVEKNPLKFGLQIPGCRIPIIPEGGAHPDAYLVTAWNFLDEFIEKERDYLLSGGEFIVPVPKVRIIGRKEALAA